LRSELVGQYLQVSMNWRVDACVSLTYEEHWSIDWTGVSILPSIRIHSKIWAAEPAPILSANADFRKL